MTAEEYFKTLNENLTDILLKGIQEAEPLIKEKVYYAWDAGENMVGDSFNGIMIETGGEFDGMRYRTLNITGEMRDKLTIDGNELFSTAEHAYKVANQLIYEGIDIYRVTADEELKDAITTNIKQIILSL